MFGLTALELARIQFGFTISFHIIFPAITIGLASYLAVLEGLWLWKGDVVYRDLYHFWSKIFAVNFAMGVVSGLVMAYQFGTNWSYFSAFAGSVTGPLLTYEVLTAFFLEAGFLGLRCLAGTKSDADCTSSQRSWCRSEHWSRRAGFSPRTAGCRRRKGSKSSTIVSCLWTG
jgi:cytochrome bd ubiquinol oxidase subunit I